MRRRFTIATFLVFLGAAAYALVQRVRAPSVDEASSMAGLHPAALVSDAVTLVALEQRGLALHRLLQAGDAQTARLVESPVYRDVTSILESDLEELDQRPGIGGELSPNHPFDRRWLRSPRTRFELVAVVNRIDRAFAEPQTCGEVRLIYRLVLEPPSRPKTRLPMTLNLVFRQPRRGGQCRQVGAQWIALPSGGTKRVDALLKLFVALGEPVRLEVNLQNLHGPTFQLNEDDHSEYLLRQFDVTNAGAKARLAFNTPRTDLASEERNDLAKWIADHFDEIDQGTAVIPDRYLAARAISATPRGLARLRNRPFVVLFADRQDAFASLPYERGRLVTSPRALLRRLDEGTCMGCHQSRSVAGFHMLGEERDAALTFNALRIGISPHFAEELTWRSTFIREESHGLAHEVPRPFAEHAGGSGYGTHCGLGDKGFATWSCSPGLRCRDAHGDEVGVCVPVDGNHDGDPCENVTLTPRFGSFGDVVRPTPREGCVLLSSVSGPDACSPSAFGFAGGMCSEGCSILGEVRGETVCADLPASGYESDCFFTNRPFEDCLKKHVSRQRVRACDEKALCRDDFACARVAGASVGACVPPYFVFQLRVDGPRLDRLPSR